MVFRVGTRTESTLNPHWIEGALWGIQRKSRKKFKGIQCGDPHWIHIESTLEFCEEAKEKAQNISTGFSVGIRIESTLNPDWIERSLWGIHKESQKKLGGILCGIRIESTLNPHWIDGALWGIQRDIQKKFNWIQCGDPHWIHTESTLNRRSSAMNPKRKPKEMQWDSMWGSALNPHWIYIE